jgi:hypothetical protein
MAESREEFVIGKATPLYCLCVRFKVLGDEGRVRILPRDYIQLTRLNRNKEQQERKKISDKFLCIIFLDRDKRTSYVDNAQLGRETYNRPQ